MNNLSVVIITKNRSKDLSHCLGSILSNFVLPKEIIVVDNNSIDETKQVVMSQMKQSKTDVKYFLSKKESYPELRNVGLRKASSDWVAFIDDDCVADINWVKEIVSEINNNPALSAIMGWCQTYDEGNIYSLATLLLDTHWKKRSIKEKNVQDLSVLDSKNVVYNKSFLSLRKIEFDESRSSYCSGAAEDCDMGIQIQESGGIASCNSRAIIRHKDPRTWSRFMTKHITSWRVSKSLELKWDMESREKLKSNPFNLWVLMDQLVDNHRLSVFKKITVFFVIMQASLLDRFLFITYQEKENQL